jgi:hypothetical protein
MSGYGTPLIGLAPDGWTQSKLSLDGLEREFNSFNRLEGGVCTMCAPGDQRKSSDNQREPR